MSLVEEAVVVSLMMDAIVQNTPGYSQAYPAGVPAGYAWCSGATRGSSTPPATFTATTGWAQIYPQAGVHAASNPKATVQVANAQTYVRLKASGEWQLVQSQAGGAIVGAHFIADFSGNRSIPLQVLVGPNGTIDVGAPPAGYNTHFWVQARGTYMGGTVDGVYVQMDMRMKDGNAQLVANVGADWWRDATAEYVAEFVNNPGAGMSNWVALSPRWARFYFYSVSAASLIAQPPPPLVGSAAPGDQAPASRPPPAWSPCRAGSAQPLPP